MTTISPFTAGVYNGRMNQAKFIQERHISLKLRVFTEYVTSIRMFTECPSVGYLFDKEGRAALELPKFWRHKTRHNLFIPITRLNSRSISDTIRGFLFLIERFLVSVGKSIAGWWLR